MCIFNFDTKLSSLKWLNYNSDSMLCYNVLSLICFGPEHVTKLSILYARNFKIPNVFLICVYRTSKYFVLS